MSKKQIAILTILLAIIIDQIVKIYVKTHFTIGEGGQVKVFEWFRIHFVENNGMAMGIEFGGKAGKLFLTLFRLVAVAGIIYWLLTTIKKKMPNVVVIAIALIFAGAVGNIVDSVFYGAIFSESTQYEIATMFPEQGYGSLFHGKVVDMFYFPIIDSTWPSWVPVVGGEPLKFFNYIFNPADAYITSGVALLFLFSKKAFPKEEKKTEKVITD